MKKVKAFDPSVQILSCKVEQCPPGICIGAIPTMVERFASGFYSTYGAVGVGDKCKGSHPKEGKLVLNFKYIRKGG